MSVMSDFAKDNKKKYMLSIISVGNYSCGFGVIKFENRFLSQIFKPFSRAGI